LNKQKWLRLIQLSLIVFAMAVSVSACNSPTKIVTPTSTVPLPPPDTRVTRAPSAQLAAQAFLDSWEKTDYQSMYGQLTAESQGNITSEKFAEKYSNVMNEATVVGLEYQINSAPTNPDSADISYRLTLHTAIFGDIQRDSQMKLHLEQGEWKVQWDDAAILPDLAGGNYLGLDRQTSGRATIFDRNGNPLAAQTEAVAIGVWPDYVDLTESKGLISLLTSLTTYRSDTIVNLIENALPGAYIPLGEVAADKDPHKLELLSTWGSAISSRYSRRLYYEDGVAPQVVGYVSAIQQDEMSTYRRKGYLSDDRVGRKGLEYWGEQILTGKPGGTLYLFNPEGKPIKELASAPSEPGRDINTTIDRDFQYGVQKAMSVFKGAIVVLEKDTGRVLAMASSPGYDPNAYETDNYNWNTLLSQITNDPDLPQFNRAAQGQYPLGSVFKLVTLSAALETGRYTQATNFDCGYTFDELPGFTRYDWTYDHFQEDGVTQPSGLLTLSQGLIRSCNPLFWHIGLDLYNVGLTTAISNMARQFGLGSKTGIEGIDEEAGKVPDPAGQVDAINLAIGQGDLQVTPLQVARFVAALGNGGTLYRPQVIEKIVSRSGEVTSTFKKEAQGTLPLKPENLLFIQEAMKGVVTSQKPLGTGFLPMRGLEIPVAGKTGTATSAAGKPHAWFAGYTYAEKEDKPDIAVVVIAENAGEGSEIAAPIFRRVVELYFFGRPLKVYRWEANFDVTRSPTPIVTYTETPQSNLNP
jgi:penicillin-binding protein 2